MSFFDSLKITKWFRILSLIVTACTAVTIMTPSTADNPIVQKGLNALNMAAGNIGHNINLDDPSVPKMLQEIRTDGELKSMLQEVETLFG